MLTQTNTFTLIRAAGLSDATHDYTSLPDANMWTESLVSNVNPANEDESRITLANGYKMGDLDMDILYTSASFPGTPRAMGHVTLANVDTDALELGLAAWLDVDTATYGNTAQDLVDDLVAAGYTNSAVMTAAPYDLIAVVPKANVVDGSAYFAWDFTDVTTGATNATVSAIQFTTWPPPPKGTVISVR